MPKLKEKKKIGRPSKKESISLKQIKKLAGYGLTDPQISDILEICRASLNNYKQDPKFLDALKEGKQKADNYIIGSLFHRAMGYSHPEEKIFCDKGKIIRVETLKHYPPDPTSMIFWLKNRQHADWKDRIDPLIDQSQHTHYSIKFKSNGKYQRENNRAGLLSTLQPTDNT